MARDPYKYFRTEARDILDQLGQEVLDLEKGSLVSESVARLLRLAHTLKGAARVVKQGEIADRAHAIEDALAPFRDTSDPVPRDRIDAVLAFIDAIEARLAGLTAAPTAEEAAVASPGDHAVVAFRPPMDDLDALVSGVAQAQVQLGLLRSNLDRLERASDAINLVVDQLPRSHEAAASRAAVLESKARLTAEDLRGTFGTLERDLVAGVEQVDHELRQVRDAADRLRLTPASALFTFLERAARDVARTLGKQVVFEGHGGDVRVDPLVLNVVQGALLQVVRNAVAHGIEPTASERRAAGKSPEGRVRLEVTRRGKRASFVCSDDGRGIDLPAVQRIAQRKGLRLENAQAQQPADLLRLLLTGGMSTSGTVTDVSGRGIGLDVVRDAAQRLGGEVTIRTDAGRGTTVELEVPLSIASFEALVLECAGAGVAIPLDAVRGVVRVTHNEIVRTDQGESVFFEGRAVPLGSLRRRLLAPAPPPRGTTTAAAVVVAGRAGIAAFSVDRILGTAAIVMRPLPELAPAIGVVAGVALDAVGDPQLVLDPDHLVAGAHEPGTVTFETAPARQPVLVVDDSLTTRMLEQSILESAGYEVHLATSGEEALERAREVQYALFLVDVEMPGMDGFTFIERTRADVRLRGVPAILVTSRASAEDQQRGQNVGAIAYVIKSEFDQGVLLDHIRKVVG